MAARPEEEDGYTDGGKTLKEELSIDGERETPTDGIMVDGFGEDLGLVWSREAGKCWVGYQDFNRFFSLRINSTKAQQNLPTLLAIVFFQGTFPIEVHKFPLISC